MVLHGETLMPNGGDIVLAYKTFLNLGRLKMETYTRESAPVLYHIQKQFSFDLKMAKILLQFLIREKIYLPFMGRIYKHRCLGHYYDDCSLEDIDYNDWRLGPHYYMHRIFFDGFLWETSDVFGSMTAEQEKYVIYYNNMLPDNMDWGSIDQKWRKFRQDSILGDRE